MNTSTQAIACAGLTKRFGSLVALQNLSIEVSPGQVYGFLGPNGAGKTTTIRMLVGLSRPDSGRVSVLGGDPHDPAIRARIGYLPGELRLDGHLTVGALLDHWGRLRGGCDPALRDVLLERLQLDPGRSTAGLSTGNRRKVGLVAAFQCRPDLLILDEPTNGLDPLLQQEFAALVRQARDEGRTVFLSSHILTEVQRLADRVAVVRGGQLLTESAVTDLRHTARQQVEAVFDGPVPEADLRAVPVEALTIDGHRAAFTAGTPIQPLLETLAKHSVRTLVIAEPGLEDAFMALYRHDDKEKQQ